MLWFYLHEYVQHSEDINKFLAIVVAQIINSLTSLLLVPFQSSYTTALDLTTFAPQAETFSVIIFYEF